MTFSKLTDNTNIITTKYSSRGGKKICKITPHHSVSVQSATDIARFFRDGKKVASANYCIGVKGDIALSVPEEFRAWTSSNYGNDSQAITIEISNSSVKDPNYPISDASYNAFIDLAVDICQRYGIKAVNYDGTPNGVLTEHRMFAATQCPGEYLHNLLKSGKVAQDINARLDKGVSYGEGYVVNGLDYTAVFNPNYYIKRYPDIPAAGLTTPHQLFAHFMQCGMKEARQGNNDFDVVKYRKSNPDLNEALGDDWEAYYKHYIMFGRMEIAMGERAKF